MNDDLISRQAVIAFLQSIPYIKEHPNMGELMKEWIKQIPGVKPVQKTGRWIDDNCSECGQYVYHGDARNFCPNCGAKMEEQMIKSKKGLAAVDIVAIIGILAILAAIIIACVAGITNNKNKNKEPDTNNATTSTRLVKGEVVNKCCTIKNNTHQYKFELEGEKDEIMVRYWLEVSEQDFNSYRIGDYYRL